MKNNIKMYHLNISIYFKCFIFSICLLLTVPSFSDQHPNPYASPLLDQHPEIVLFLGHDPSINYGGGGTAAFVTPNILVTAFHNIVGYTDPLSGKLFFLDRKTGGAVPITAIIGLSAKHELVALYVGNFHSEAFYSIDTEINLIKDGLSRNIKITGFPDFQFAVAEGRIQDKQFSDPFIQASVLLPHQLFSRNSGGPILFENNKLVGILNQADPDLSISFTPVEKVKELLLGPRLTCMANTCINDELDKLQQDGEAGDVASQFVLGYFHYLGIGFPEDKKTAFNWFKQAASQGHVRSQFNVGIMLIEGQGIPQDQEEGAEWLQKSADQSHFASQLRLLGLTSQ